ncbi:hypothetical protein [Cognatishimia maritima]|uniref:Uncharacterized protein n=1 Tax=Cognatishimia maritima TaxID=870908 RepID=A0A1M5V3G4_9RHOB|nr:hypothetical protein [Cognatishimia maritima]SHH69746.1 hypothetical protein SAMN04488044_3067 [Cognatishimia maritima]
MTISIQKTMCGLGASLALATSLIAQERQAEDQTPTGKFLTAVEVKPILGATQANWIAVREWEGQDLLYFTHLLSWRCGIYEIRYSINEEAPQLWPFPECDPDTYTVGVIPEGTAIYAEMPLRSVDTVTIELLYDDLTTESARFARESVLIP